MEMPKIYVNPPRKLYQVMNYLKKLNKDRKKL